MEKRKEILIHQIREIYDPWILTQVERFVKNVNEKA